MLAIPSFLSGSIELLGRPCLHAGGDEAHVGLPLHTPVVHMARLDGGCTFVKRSRDYRAKLGHKLCVLVGILAYYMPLEGFNFGHKECIFN